MYLTTKIQQTEKNHEIDLNILRGLCYHSARLYNVGLYNIRQHYFNTQTYLTYNSNYHETKTNENYSILLSDCSQQVLRIADRDMQSFFKLLTLKKSGKYSEKICLPRYKDKEGLMVCPINGRSCRIQKDGTVSIGLTSEFREKYGINEKKITLSIPRNIRNVKEFKEIRIIPEFKGRQFTIEFIYEQDKACEQAKGDGYMSIDPGVSNLATCTFFSNGESGQFIIDGKRLKNINHYYNKKTAMLKSEYFKNKSIKSTNTKRMIRLSNGRRNRIDEYLNNAVKHIVNTCISNNVTTIVIGYNKEQKQSINIGRRNNQNFCYIPLDKFRTKLKYKCEIHGIKYCPQEESYTSKASSIYDDPIPNFGDTCIPEFSGRRDVRMYYASDGTRINADVNGSINILKKYLKTCKSNVVITTDDVRALVNKPCQRVYPFAKAATSLV